MSVARRLFFVVALMSHLNSTALAFLPMPRTNPALQDTVAFSQQALQKYKSFQTVGDLAQALKLYLKSEDQIFLDQQIKNKQNFKLFKATVTKNEFTLSDGKNIFQMKILNPKTGEVEINHHLISLDLRDLKTSWGAIEKALPKPQQALLYKLLIPEAQAEAGFLVAIGMIGLIGLHAFVNIAWMDHKLSSAIQSCEKAKKDSLLIMEGPKSADEKDQLQKFVNSLESARIDSCDDPSNRDAFCRDNQKLVRCLDEIKPLASKWLGFEKKEGALQQAPSHSNSNSVH